MGSPFKGLGSQFERIGSPLKDDLTWVHDLRHRSVVGGRDEATGCARIVSQAVQHEVAASPAMALCRAHCSEPPACLAARLDARARAHLHVGNRAVFESTHFLFC